FDWPWFMPSIQQYKMLVDQTPFNDSHVWEENADREFPDADAITAWIDQPSLVPFLRQLHGIKRQQFRDEAVERILQVTRLPHGAHFETFRRVNVLARK